MASATVGIAALAKASELGTAPAQALPARMMMGACFKPPAPPAKLKFNHLGRAKEDVGAGTGCMMQSRLWNRNRGT